MICVVFLLMVLCISFSLLLVLVSYYLLNHLLLYLLLILKKTLQFIAQSSNSNPNLHIFTLEGWLPDITHLERSANKLDIDNHIRTFVEWWLLSLSDVMVICRSGFGETASVYNCAPAIYFLWPYQISHSIVLPSGFCNQYRIQRSYSLSRKS
eukprot:TRINITY_DN517_c0_g1_i5.p1 TRINITY_DN517_c0_g1~~TRINITY_DN517_c0_g1_i5.p1  ORF type:complete len:153 (+),score=13.09 TRINITY_DN517_c0_g1_i5:130-588(+)